jgi:hypothetical protein
MMIVIGNLSDIFDGDVEMFDQGVEYSEARVVGQHIRCE